MSGQFRYDYYWVDVPTDLGTLSERADQAITEAREQARLYVMPCEWEVIDISPFDSSVRVRRRRRR